MKIAGHGRAQKQKTSKIEPLPMRPTGYFTNVYSEAEMQEDSLLAKASVVRAPKDLE